MHEVSIVQSLFGILNEKMKDLYGRSFPVTGIKVVVGKLTNVVPDALEFAFELVSKGTSFENAKIEVEYIPLKVKCIDCQQEMELDEPFMFCQKCDSFNLEILTGKELFVNSFEINDADIMNI